MCELGVYTLNNDSRFVCGITSFSFPKGGKVIVKQHSKEYGKVLLDFGGGMTDWFPDAVLKLLDKVD